MRPFVLIAISSITGILVGSRFMIGPVFFYVSLFPLLFALWHFRDRVRVFNIVLVCNYLLIGAFWVGLYDRWMQPEGLKPWEGAGVACLGEVRGPIETGVGYYGSPVQRFVLDGRALIRDGLNREEARKVRGRIAVTLYGPDAPELVPGDRVVVAGELRRVPSGTNPGQFSQREWFENRSLFWQLTARSAGECVRVHAGDGTSAWLAGLRRRGLALLERFVPRPYAGLAQALALGERSQVRGLLRERFAETGTVHILAISGLHVGILAGMLLFLFSRVIGSIPVRTGLAVLFLVAYIPLTGAAAPVIRAVILFAVLLLGRILGRGTDALHSLALACLVILAINPHHVEMVSFQFSFGAVLAILIIAPRLVKRMDPVLGRGAFGRFWVRLFAVSFAAWLILAPSVLARFHLFTPVALLANLVILPLLVPLFAFFWLFFALASFWTLAGSLLGQAIGSLLAVMDGFVNLAGGVPMGSFYLAAPPAWVILSCYVGLGVWLFRHRLKGLAAPVLLLLLLAGNFWAWSSFAQKLFPPGELTLAFLDVGQGDALVIEAPGGGVIVIDAGRGEPQDRGRSAVSPYLWSRSHTRISGTVMTHTDFDHVGGLAAVSKRFPAVWALEGPIQTRGPAYEDYREAGDEGGVRRMTLYRGDRIQGSEGLEIVCLHPPRSWSDDKGVSDNDRSLVLKVRYRDFTALLTADAGADAIQSLIDSGQDLSARLLKVPHHGAPVPPELLQEFLGRVRPEGAVVNVGENNRYGHPDPETIRLVSEVSKLFRTDRSGAVIFQTDGTRIRVKTFSEPNFITL